MSLFIGVIMSTTINLNNYTIDYENIDKSLIDFANKLALLLEHHASLSTEIVIDLIEELIPSDYWYVITNDQIKNSALEVKIYRNKTTIPLLEIKQKVFNNVK